MIDMTLEPELCCQMGLAQVSVVPQCTVKGSSSEFGKGQACDLKSSISKRDWIPHSRCV